MSTIVTGLEWIHDNMVQPAVVLMSIGGTGTLLLDQACQSLVNAGAVVVVAAGNNAAGTSPSSSFTVIVLSTFCMQFAIPMSIDLLCLVLVAKVPI